MGGHGFKWQLHVTTTIFIVIFCWTQWFASVARAGTVPSKPTFWNDVATGIQHVEMAYAGKFPHGLHLIRVGQNKGGHDSVLEVEMVSLDPTGHPMFAITARCHDHVLGSWEVEHPPRDVSKIRFGVHRQYDYLHGNSPFAWADVERRKMSFFRAMQTASLRLGEREMEHWRSVKFVLPKKPVSPELANEILVEFAFNPQSDLLAVFVGLDGNPDHVNWLRSDLVHVDFPPESS